MPRAHPITRTVESTASIAPGPDGPDPDFLRVADATSFAGSPDWLQSGAPSAFMDWGLDLRRFFGLLRRQLRIIVGVIVAVCGLTTILLLQLQPLYDSTALVIADPRQTSGIDPGTQMALSGGDLARVDTEVEILRSPAVFVEAIRNLHLATDLEFAEKSGWREWIAKVAGLEAEKASAEDQLKQVLKRLQDAVTISRSGLTYLIRVTARSNSPERSAEIANGVADAYIFTQINSKAQVVADVQLALQSRVSEASAALREAETRLDNFVEQQVTEAAEGDQPEIAELRRQINEQVTLTNRLGSLIQSTHARLSSSDWQGLVDELDSEVLTRLNERREELNRALQDASAPQANDLRAQLAETIKQISDQAGTTIEKVQTQLAEAQTNEQNLRATLREKAISSQILPKEVLVRLYQLQQEADATRSVYENVLNRSKAVEAQRELQLPDSRIISRALPPAAPSFPRKKLILAVVGLASLALGFALAFVREHYVGGLTDEEQTQAVIGIPVLGSIPNITRDEEVPSDPIATEIVTHPLSPYSEAVRRVRSALDAAQGWASSDGPRVPLVILLTSALPGEGKSQTAISIARSYAAGGRSVLLIDCDLRRPSVHEALNLHPTQGLADYLASPAAFSEILWAKDPLTSLRIVLGSVGRHSDTMSLLETGKFETLLKSARSEFDVIVIDSSPLLPVVDARLLARFASAIVLVIQARRTSQHDVRAALRDLRRYVVKSALVGAVLNRVEAKGRGYGYSAYTGGEQS